MRFRAAMLTLSSFLLGGSLLLAAWAQSPRAGKSPTSSKVTSKLSKTVDTAHPTFANGVASILFDHCASCHRPGEAAPFSLLTYADAKKHSGEIVAATKAKLMPPWKATSDCAFEGDNRLTDAQISTLQAWVANGTPEGNAANTPAPPKFTSGWKLGTPDLIVKMPKAFKVYAEGRDIYRTFVVPTNLPEDTYIRAIDFRPSAPSVVHHCLFFWDGTGSLRERDGQDGQPGFSGGMSGVSRRSAGNGQNERGGGVDRDAQAALSLLDSGKKGSTFGSLGGWALGAQPSFLPDGLANYLPKGADLILSTHFHPSGKAEEEQSMVGLYFAKKAPEKEFTGIQMPPFFGALNGLNIPAGEKNYAIEDSYTLPVDVKAFGVSGHAHYLGREMKMTATFPDGKTTTLFWIPDWDFAWQGQYIYQNYVDLPKGTKLHTRITWDNSTSNPRNPTNPPKQVRWGEQSTDEMGSISLRLVAKNDEDLPVLQKDYRQHIFAVALLSGRRLLQGGQRGGQNGVRTPNAPNGQ